VDLFVFHGAIVARRGARGARDGARCSASRMDRAA
jgi:hypothetical protein